jgi:hypothetical protein
LTSILPFSHEPANTRTGTIDTKKPTIYTAAEVGALVATKRHEKVGVCLLAIE